jgi:endonuclease/exonuclease/phosphatase family metal-dependent hydrolase
MPSRYASIPRTRGSAVALAAATVSAVAVLAGLPSSAAAAAVTPAAPTGARLVAATGTSLTVAARTASHATGYRLFASTRRSDVYVANISKARASSIARSPRMTIGGLAYTTATYYYRVQAVNGSKHRFDSVIHAAALRPATPAGLRVSNADNGTWLSWRSVSATGYSVDVATNATMTTGHHTYSVRDLTPQFTPYGLATGTTYWFRVRAVTHGTASPWSGRVSAKVVTRRQSFTVMTYNLLAASFAGTKAGGTTVAAWSSRRPGAVQLIKQGAPDILCVQEAADFIGPKPPAGHTRQVDDLIRALGGAYGLARTEVPPTEPGWMRTGLYVLYKKSTFTAAGGNHWVIGDGRWAAYQLMRARSTGATVLLVTPHLFGNTGRAYDTRRQHETQKMLDLARPYAAAHHVPVVYAGDFNSNTSSIHVFDGPAIAMRSAHTLDAQDAAVHLYNASYNSANQYLRTPPRGGHSVDYVYASAGVGVLSRSVVLRLSQGKFVGVIPSDHNPVQTRLEIRTR